MSLEIFSLLFPKTDCVRHLGLGVERVLSAPQAASPPLLIPVCSFISHSKSTLSEMILTRKYLLSCCDMCWSGYHSSGPPTWAHNVCITPLIDKVKTRTLLLKKDQGILSKCFGGFFFSLGPWGLMVGTKNWAGTTNRWQQTKQDRSRIHGMAGPSWCWHTTVFVSFLAEKQ